MNNPAMSTGFNSSFRCDQGSSREEDPSLSVRDGSSSLKELPGHPFEGSQPEGGGDVNLSVDDMPEDGGDDNISIGGIESLSSFPTPPLGENTIVSRSSMILACKTRCRCLLRLSALEFH